MLVTCDTSPVDPWCFKCILELYVKFKATVVQAKATHVASVYRIMIVLRPHDVKSNVKQYNTNNP